MSVMAANGRPALKRWAVVLLAVLGLGLIAAPAIFQMFDRAPKGATMIAGFQPFMTDARMNSFKANIATIRDGVRQGDNGVASYLDAADKAAFNRQYPAFASFASEWGPIDRDMVSMLDQMQAQIPNYEAVAALPNFKLFPWFFVIPGVILLLLGGLAALRPSSWRWVRWVALAIGVGLILAPAAFQMFERAPKGAKMVAAFTEIETRPKVETIQGYFGTIASGQGSLRLDLIPALKQKGLTDRQIAERFPAVVALDRQWIPILQNLTPMIAAMSDNVVNYQAVAALPDFRLFPWFFVLPGIFVIALILLAGFRNARGASADPEAQSTAKEKEVH